MAWLKVVQHFHRSVSEMSITVPGFTPTMPRSYDPLASSRGVAVRVGAWCCDGCQDADPLFSFGHLTAGGLPDPVPGNLCR